MEVSFSRLKTYHRCQMKYHYRYDMRLERKVKALPLKRGGAVHSCLEEFYKRGNYARALKVIKRDYNKLFEEERELYGDLPEEVERIMEAYLEEYGNDHWKVHAVEEEFSVPISGLSKRAEPTNLTGVVDLVAEDRQGVWLIDHKTAKSIPETSLSLVDLQTTLYYWAWLERGEKVSGVMLNYLRTKAPSIPQVLKKGGISRRKIDTTRKVYEAAIEAQGLDVSDYVDILEQLDHRVFFARQKLAKPEILVEHLLDEVRHSVLRLQANLPPLRAVDRSCTWDCDYKNLCLTDLQGGDIQSVIDMDYKVREPREEVIEDGEENGDD